MGQANWWNLGLDLFREWNCKIYSFFFFLDFYFSEFLFEIVSLFFFLSLSWQRYDSMTYGNLNVKYSAGLLSRFIISTFNFTIRRFVRTIISVYRSSKTLRTRWDDIIDNRSVTDFISDLQFKKTKRDEFQHSVHSSELTETRSI